MARTKKHKPGAAGRLVAAQWRAENPTRASETAEPARLITAQRKVAAVEKKAAAAQANTTKATESAEPDALIAAHRKAASAERRTAAAERRAAAAQANTTKAFESSEPNPATGVSPDTGATIYFYKPDKQHGFLSQWYHSPFTNPATGHKYTTAEQYMMHSKALLFDSESALCTQMLSTNDPGELKRMGRLVANFDQEVWEKNREAIVTEGNYLKFSQNRELRQSLLETAEMELVEAAGRDRIWGIGFGAEKAPYERKRWGKNLLGKALMAVRERLKKELSEMEAESTQGAGKPEGTESTKG